jgi:hypothetical protein
MARCGYCNSMILMGGTQVGNLRFCNEKCAAQGQLLIRSRQVPDAHVQELVYRMHQGPCPKCGGAGPIDVFTTYRIWSAVFLTSWKNVPEVCCKSCGTKSQIGGLVTSLLFGWWGFPWGLIMTPVQIIRNLRGMMRSVDRTQPSEELARVARIQLASQMSQAA